MSYAYAEGVVWVSDLTPDGHPMEHDMCTAHADAVRVPRGWALHDERTSSEPHLDAARHDLVGA